MSKLDLPTIISMQIQQRGEISQCIEDFFAVHTPPKQKVWTKKSLPLCPTHWKSSAHGGVPFWEYHHWDFNDPLNTSLSNFV